MKKILLSSFILIAMTLVSCTRGPEDKVRDCVKALHSADSAAISKLYTPLRYAMTMSVNSFADKGGMAKLNKMAKENWSIDSIEEKLTDPYVHGAVKHAFKVYAHKRGGKSTYFSQIYLIDIGGELFCAVKK